MKIRRLGWWLGCALCGCNAGGGGGGGAPSVAIHSVTVEPTTVPDGGAFTVKWDVSYANGLGVVTDIGLYLGAPGELTTSSARSGRALFALADTGGAPNRPGTSATCTRTGGSVRCTPGNSSVSVTTGAVALTFRLCSAEVLNSASEVCDTRALTLTIP